MCANCHAPVKLRYSQSESSGTPMARWQQVSFDRLRSVTKRSRVCRKASNQTDHTEWLVLGTHVCSADNLRPAIVDILDVSLDKSSTPCNQIGNRLDEVTVSKFAIGGVHKHPAD